jgi:hypothetical protein
VGNTIHQAQNIVHLRFCTIGTPWGTPFWGPTIHIIDTSHNRSRYIEIMHQDEVWRCVIEQPTPPLIAYTSGIGNCIHALPKHVQQRLVGHIPTLAMPPGWDTTDPKDLIVATYGSCQFCPASDTIPQLGNYDSRWGDTEHGDGPVDSDPLLMPSYRSELGGLASSRLISPTRATIFWFLGHPVFFWIINPPTVFLVENKIKNICF